MICGILSLVTCCCCIPSAPLAIVSIVLGILQLNKGTTKGMAIAGIICSAVGLVLMIVSLVFSILFGDINYSSDFYNDYFNNYYDMIEELEDI